MPKVSVSMVFLGTPSATFTASLRSLVLHALVSKEVITNSSVQGKKRSI